MQRPAVSLKNIICGIQSLPPDALLELDHFVTFLHHKMDSSAQKNIQHKFSKFKKGIAGYRQELRGTATEILGYNEHSLPE